MEAAIITGLGMLTIALIERIFDNKRFGKQLQREREWRLVKDVAE